MFRGFGVYITCSSNFSSFQFAPNFLKLISSLAICIDYIDPPEFPIPQLAMASSSSAVATSFSNQGYDVFINHRGTDVKKTFASHLYRRLVSHRLRPFLDMPELEIEDNIVTQIERAIATASVHVAIFSPNYAESRWCLDELVLMLRSRASILPVFYHVKPSDLRWPDKGMYSRAFRYHEEKKRYDLARIHDWKKAISRVSDIIGFELDAFNSDEAELLEKVVERVLELGDFETRLDEKVKDFANTVLLQRQSGKPQVLGIVGFAGVGKTTLAKKLFDKMQSSFRRSFFLSNIREKARKNGLHFLQSELCEGLINFDIQVDSVTEDIELFKENASSIYGSSALVILDDVDQVNQLGALLPDQNYSPSKSLILITSRNKDVLTRFGIENMSIYELTPSLDVAKYPSSSTSEIPVKSALLHSSSASPVSTSISNYRYDVFINHAPELKKTFANHLYYRLVFYGLQPFQESQEMEKGDNLATEIKKTILKASVHVAIISGTYAESHLCLDELLLMLESKAPVFPVFYNVKPFELQLTKVKDEVYARALQHPQKTTYDSHTDEEKPRYSPSPDTIEKWRLALDRISRQGNRLELEKFKGDEAELLDSVVKIVLEKVRKAPLYVFENRIGLDEMVEDLENTVLLQRQRGKPQVVGIVGSSGAGKTTLAQKLINEKSSSFNRTCFLFDVRKTVASSPLHLLQIKLFKDLTNMNIQIESVAQGIELFTKDISSIVATAFVILDDIDDVHQLKALLPVQNVLPSKSLILITSRSKNVLTSSGVEESSIYNLTVLDRKVKGFADAVLLQQYIGNLQIVGINRQSSSLAKYPSVLDRKVKIFADTVLLQWESKEPQIVGIVGLAGIGKTRLAREFFNRKSSNYRRSYFFYDVTENARTSFSLHTLQSKLLLGLTQLDLQVESEDEGIYLFKEHVSPFRSLVILDNVDHCDHLHALLSVLNVLPSSSLILITSRDKDVLKLSGLEDSSIYELEGLNTEDSLELFCTHAFGQSTPRPEFQDLADEFLRTCNGLPLTLKVFGALLWGKLTVLTGKNY